MPSENFIVEVGVDPLEQLLRVRGTMMTTDGVRWHGSEARRLRDRWLHQFYARLGQNSYGLPPRFTLQTACL